MKIRLIEVNSNYKVQIEKYTGSHEDISVFNNYGEAKVNFDILRKHYKEGIEKGIMDKNGEFIVTILEEVEIPQTISNDKN